MTLSDAHRKYFNWLYKSVKGDKGPEEFRYRKLLTRLHDITFRWSMEMDQNRAEDGISLRYRFALDQGYEDDSDYIMDILEGPCSVLEMMVALSFRCEEIMDNACVGDRTSQWFWGMIVNLGLGSMHDSLFDRQFVDETIDVFLDRDYEPDGRRGLFTIRHCERDLRDMEIWQQLCWYLNTIT